MDKKMISPHNEWYIENVLVCAHFSSKLAHCTYCLRSITQLFRLYGILYIFPMLMPKPCSGDFNVTIEVQLNASIYFKTNKS